MSDRTARFTTLPAAVRSLAMTADHARVRELAHRWDVLRQARDRIENRGSVSGDLRTDPRLGELIDEAWTAYTAACKNLNVCRHIDCMEQRRAGHAHCERHAGP